MSSARQARREEQGGQYRPRRLHFVMGILLLCVCGLAVRAVHLQWLQHEFLNRQGELRNLRIEPLAAHRGVIMDRNRRPLAVSTPVTTLWANPREVLAARDQWSRLAGNPVLDVATLRQRVEAYPEREFIYLARHLAPETAQQVLSRKVPGIYSLTEYRRYYPAGEVVSHLVGFTNIDDRGQEGLELALDARLQGRPGRKQVVRDLTGRVIQDIAVLEEARPGEDVVLSIDLRLQYLAYRELLAGVQRHGAAAGTAVVLDARTGEVLAMVNQPAFNPNNRAGVRLSALRNRAITDVFEPGSTIKPLTVAAALESGLINLDSRINTHPGTMRVASKVIRDFRDYGIIDVATLLAKSSNVGTVKLALSMDPHQLPAFMAGFGLGEETGVTFPGESLGLLPIRAQWRDIEIATLSYGYGLSVTALQLARAYGVLANGGQRLPLTLERRDQVPEGLQVLDPHVAHSLIGMLEGVASDTGTARRARVDGYRVAGKTGTVHKLAGGGYAEDRYQSIMAGVAPVADPRYVVVVMIDDPQGDYYGGLVAAPVLGRIMEGVLRTLNVEPDAPVASYATLSLSGGAAP